MGNYTQGLVEWYTLLGSGELGSRGGATPGFYYGMICLSFQGKNMTHEIVCMRWDLEAM